jgi:hypothetical protein
LNKRQAARLRRRHTTLKILFNGQVEMRGNLGVEVGVARGLHEKRTDAVHSFA